MTTPGKCSPNPKTNAPNTTLPAGLVELFNCLIADCWLFDLELWRKTLCFQAEKVISRQEHLRRKSPFGGGRGRTGELLKILPSRGEYQKYVILPPSKEDRSLHGKNFTSVCGAQTGAQRLTLAETLELSDCNLCATDYGWQIKYLWFSHQHISTLTH